MEIGTQRNVEENFKMSDTVIKKKKKKHAYSIIALQNKNKANREKLQEIQCEYNEDCSNI